MIKEDFVSYEVAKLLKEKGFDEPCYTYYDDIDNSINRFDKGLHFNNTSYPWGVPYDVKKAKKYIVAPTHQMAMAWLRQTRDIVISIFPTIETDMIVREDYNYAIYKNKTVVYQSCSTSYEKAVETAIKYCLENLIEL